jgi:hypothetical protein
MSDSQRPEREAIERRAARLRGFIQAHVTGGCRVLSSECECPLCDVDELLLAALPPTPTPGSVKELREWLRDEAEFAHQKGWNDRAETLMDVEAKCDDVGIALPPAPTGGRE